MKICKDGRIWGQTNKQASDHLGILTWQGYIKKESASECKKGNQNPMFGRKHSLETRRKISEASRGHKHYNWKDGITSDKVMIRQRIEYRLWREAVFARDSWICQECGKQGGQLNAHHIKSFTEYPELRFAIDNGKTLCYECHKIMMKGNTYARHYSPELGEVEK